MRTATRRPNPHPVSGFRLRSVASAAALTAVLALAAISEAGQPVALIDDGDGATTVSKARSDSLAKAKSTAAKPKSTAAKPTTTAAKPTATPNTQASATARKTTAAKAAPTAKSPPAASTQPAAKAQTKAAATAKTEPSAARPTTVARLTPSAAGPPPQAKTAASPAVATKAPAPASGGTKTKPGGATVSKAAPGAATVATLTSGAAASARSGQARQATPAPQPASPSQGAVRPAGQTGSVRATKGSTVARSSTDKPVPRGARAAGSTLAVAVPLDDHVTYQYNALGRRDVFTSLMEGEFVGADVGGDAPPDVGGFKVVGIVWGSDDQFAMVEDARGESYVLRRGDKVMNGYVEGLKRDAIIVSITVDGQTQSVRIPVTRKGEKSNAIR